MKILVVCDARNIVPPDKYGGTERVAHLLCEGLSKRGHTINLLSARGSKRYSGKSVYHTHATTSRLDRAFRKAYFQWLSFKAKHGCDAVITFGRPDYVFGLQLAKTPIVFRFGNPVDQNQIDSIEKRGISNIRYIGVSNDQFKDVRTEVPVTTIYNSVPIHEFAFSERPSKPPYVLYLGRITPNKGVHLAIQSAKAAGYHLKIAGNVPASEPGALAYYKSSIQPYLGNTIEHIGPVNQSEKRALLSNATAMLFPIQWREPCANVVPEALACGCPVIAWKNGSVPEVIEDGKTGYIVESLEGMINAIHRIDEIDRGHCRAEAERRFNADTMVSQYLQVIQNLAEKTP